MELKGWDPKLPLARPTSCPEHGERLSGVEGNELTERRSGENGSPTTLFESPVYGVLPRVRASNVPFSLVLVGSLLPAARGDQTSTVPLILPPICPCPISISHPGPAHHRHFPTTSHSSSSLSLPPSALHYQPPPPPATPTPGAPGATVAAEGWVLQACFPGPSEEPPSVSRNTQSRPAGVGPGGLCPLLRHQPPLLLSLSPPTQPAFCCQADLPKMQI